MKLSDKQVQEIKRMLNQRDATGVCMYTQEGIAKLYGVSASTISRLGKGK